MIKIKIDRYLDIYWFFGVSDDLRLFCDYFIGETTTIGYDYSGWNAATIARPYWLSGESPKRDTAVAANGSAPPYQEESTMPG